MSSVGVLGGSFDPVHRGHVALAREARRLLNVDRVLLLPCAAPPHKPGRTLAARFHRLEMLYLATEDQPGLCVSTFEIARGGVHFTIDTLRALRGRTPAVAPVFVCGGDALAEIASWRDYESLLDEFDFAAVIRREDAGGERRSDWPESVRRRLSPLPPAIGLAPGAGGRVFTLDGPVPAVSSSLVRDRCAAGDPIDALVPARVARYIQRHRLYSEEAAR